MKKDLLTLIATASIVALLVGCGSSGKSTKKSSVNTPTPTATVAPTATATATPAPTATATPAPTATTNPAGNDTSDPLPF